MDNFKKNVFNGSTNCLSTDRTTSYSTNIRAYISGNWFVSIIYRLGVVSLPSGFVTVLHADKESTNDVNHRGHPGNIT